MTWQEIANKNSKLMKEFRGWLKKQPKFYRMLEFERLPIQDIFAWIQCFAETKGIYLYYKPIKDVKRNCYIFELYYEKVADKRRIMGATEASPDGYNDPTVEDAMFRLTIQFFEVAG